VIHALFSNAVVFIDGTLGFPRLSHPEGLAVHPDGSIWCGGDRGEIYRIEGDGSKFELVGSTEGFNLGMVFDKDENLYICDLGASAIFKLNTKTKNLVKLSKPGLGMKIPNYPILDAKRNRLLVSDSHEPHVPGPGIWQIDLSTGVGSLWCDEVFDFANGMVFSPDGNSILVVESWGKTISRIEINSDGSAGNKSIFLENIDAIPDGLALDDIGNLFIACYEPSRIMCLDTSGKMGILVEDNDAHLLCHPTNIAFRGSELFTTNLGRWHITQITTKTFGKILNF
jgi:sugar lactone lactonase YvrE